MRSTQLITGALAVAATSALIGLGTAPGIAQTPDPTAPGTSRETGKLLECIGAAGSISVRANVYQNDTFGNYLEVLVHDGTPEEAGVSRKAAKPFVVKNKVRAVARIAGKKVVITGTAKPTGQVERVHEVVEDAGLRIVSRGKHKLLKPVLEVSYAGQSGKLTCDNAFAFNLKITKTSIVD